MSTVEKNQRYSKDLKLEAIRRIIEEGESVIAVADSLSIRHRDNVYKWIKKYKNQGEGAFESSIRAQFMMKQDHVEKRLDELNASVEEMKQVLHQIAGEKAHS